ncbi:MAG: hypothetical protein LBE62_02275 [Azonexus sp.]|jgi:hypothetical protein|nr:hypothetical protein [Azonexus sp.]
MAINDTPFVYSGQGPVMMGRYDPVNGKAESGFLVDLYRIGCGTRTLTTTVSRETTMIRESCSGQRLDLAELETGKSMTVALSLAQFNGRTLAAALFGQVAEQAAGTVTEEPLPPLVAGDYFTTRHPKISSVVIEDSTPSTPITYVEGTHYTIESAQHARLLLTAHPTAHVEPLKIDYEYEDYLNIAAFTAKNVERGIIFNGLNSAGQNVRVIVPRISLAMNGDFGWINEEEATLELSGSGLFVAELQNDPLFGAFMRVDLLGDE